MNFPCHQHLQNKTLFKSKNRKLEICGILKNVDILFRAHELTLYHFIPVTYV